MSRIDRLRALADLLEESLTEASIGVRAQIAAQYRATLADIEEIEKASAPAAPRGSGVDQVAERRAARESGTARPA